MTIKVNCPSCDAQVEWSEKSAYRPFCSERCKQIDLGSWADERYTIPIVEQTELSDESNEV
jgi:hypothetical protein